MRSKSKPKEFIRVETVGIVGAGMMGIEIAAANVRCGMKVWVYDTNPDILATAQIRLARELTDLSEQAWGKAMALLHTGTLRDVAECDLIIEAIHETLEAKTALYQALQPLLKPSSVLVTNTSTISIDILRKAVSIPKRFAGLHFLHPVRFRELVEVISTGETRETIVQSLCDYLLMIEKTPLCVDDCPGFVVNRLLQAYLNEAMHLLLEGVPMKAVELAAQGFGMFWGPLRTMDEIGLDVVYHSGRVLYEAYPERVSPSPILISMLKKKMLGRKTGKGFYDWGAEWEEHLGDHHFDPVDWNTQTIELVDHWKTENLILHPTAEIGERLATAMAMEGGRIIVDGIVGEQGQVDMAAVTGLGFPVSKGGPMAWFERTQLS